MSLLFFQESVVSLPQGGVCWSCRAAGELGVLLPHLAGVIVGEVAAAAGLLLVTARARAPGRATTAPQTGARARSPNSRTKPPLR